MRKEKSMILIDMRRRIVSDRDKAELQAFATLMHLGNKDFAVDPKEDYPYYKLPLKLRFAEALAHGAKIVNIPTLDNSAYRRRSKAPVTGMEKYRPGRRHRRHYGPKPVLNAERRN
jgi:hypothetical protein